MKLKWFLPVSCILLLFGSLLLGSCAPAGYRAGYGNGMYYYPGIGLGSVIAVVVSWSRNQSILWAIIHGLLGWLYVIYAILVRPKK